MTDTSPSTEELCVAADGYRDAASIGALATHARTQATTIAELRAEVERLQAEVERMDRLLDCGGDHASLDGVIERIALCADGPLLSGWTDGATACQAEVDAWKETAAQENRNRDYYRGLVDEVAALLGPAVFVADDGSTSDTPLRAKVPDLVRAALAVRAEAEAGLCGLVEAGKTWLRTPYCAAHTPGASSTCIACSTREAADRGVMAALVAPAALGTRLLAEAREAGRAEERMRLAPEAAKLKVAHDAALAKLAEVGEAAGVVTDEHLSTGDPAWVRAWVALRTALSASPAFALARRDARVRREALEGAAKLADVEVSHGAASIGTARILVAAWLRALAAKEPTDG